MAILLKGCLVTLGMLFLLFFVTAFVVPLILGIWYRLFPKKAFRDVSRRDDVELDETQELVEDEGEPLKPDQHRLIHRDPKLLPKPKVPATVWPRPKKKRVMSKGDADRFFAATLRTKNRHIRDLIEDEAQLERYGLPRWRNEAEVAEALELPIGKLRHYSIHRQRERVCHYVTFAIPKRRGGERLILAPKRELKAIQRRLLRHLVDKLPVSEYAHGFRRGHSVRSGAEMHVGKTVVLSMDLRDFFPSVTYARVRGLLIALGYGYPVASTLAVLMTEAERQPVDIDGEIFHVPVGPRHCVQGAPTSPGLSNAICQRLDHRLAGLARKYGWNYSRYADDLAFSGNTPADVHTVRRLATRICIDEGFAVHPDKTRIARHGRRQRVTGVVVNEVLGLSRKERRRLRATIHRLAKDPENATLSDSQLRGKLAYLQMLNPEQAEPLWQRLDRM